MADEAAATHAWRLSRPDDAGEELVAAYDADLCSCRKLATFATLEDLPRRLADHRIASDNRMRAHIERGRRCAPRRLEPSRHGQRDGKDCSAHAHNGCRVLLAQPGQSLHCLGRAPDAVGFPAFYSDGSDGSVPEVPTTSSCAARTLSLTRPEIVMNSSMRTPMAAPCLRRSSASAAVSAEMVSAMFITVCPVFSISAAMASHSRATPCPGARSLICRFESALGAASLDAAWMVGAVRCKASPIASSRS